MINHAQRIQQIFASLADNSLVLISSGEEQIRNRDVEFPFRVDSDFFYLTGFAEPDSVLVLVKKEGKQQTIIFVRPKDKTQETWQGRRLGVELAIEKLGLTSGSSQAFSIDDFAEEMPAIILDIENIYFSFTQLERWSASIDEWIITQKSKARQGIVSSNKLYDIDSLLHEARLIKLPAEIEIIRQAAQISVKGHIKAMQACKNAVYEYQIQAELEAEFKELGSPRVAFNSIVASSGNACILHYTENTDKLTENALILVDAGAEYQGYAGDVTSTFPNNGKFSPAQKQLYDLVLKAEQAVIALVKPNLQYDEMHNCAEQIITKGLLELGILKGKLEELIKEKAYKKFFMHGTGHWLGMDVHDVGNYKINKQWRKLKPGMVFTVEPGIYISAEVGKEKGIDKKYWDIGIRIEDDILVTETGAEILSTGLPRSTQEIELAME